MTKKTISAFRSTYDRAVVIPDRIRAALAALAKAEGPEAWEKESEFLKRSGVSSTDLGRFRDAFEPHVVRARPVGGSKGPHIIWFADPKVAAKVREGDG